LQDYEQSTTAYYVVVFTGRKVIYSKTAAMTNNSTEILLSAIFDVCWMGWFCLAVVMLAVAGMVTVEAGAVASGTPPEESFSKLAVVPGCIAV
jgi:hypothetical protein